MRSTYDMIHHIWCLRACRLTSRHTNEDVYISSSPLILSSASKLIAHKCSDCTAGYFLTPGKLEFFFVHKESGNYFANWSYSTTVYICDSHPQSHHATTWRISPNGARNGVTSVVSNLCDVSVTSWPPAKPTFSREISRCLATNVNCSQQQPSKIHCYFRWFNYKDR